MDEFLCREHARALRGEKVFGEVNGRKYKRVSIVAGKHCGSILAPLEYHGTTDSALFEYWFENLLLPIIPEKSVIVMDNAAFHRKEILSVLAAKFHCSLLFLPPYSPDLNSIEKFWAWLKQKLKALLPFYDSFDDALTAAFNVE